MNRKVEKWFLGLMMVLMMAVVTPLYLIDGYAATARISFSDPSTKVGETFTVTMKFTCTSGENLGDTKVMLKYDATMLEFLNDTSNASGGTGAIAVRSGVEGKSEAVTELRFKALRAGSSSITITDWDGYDNSGQALNVEKEGVSAVTIASLPTSSNDATLQSLQISPGTLEPSFSPDVEQYMATVGLDVDLVRVSAIANNDNAVVAVEGGEGLNEGENTVTCKVTAQDGTSTRNYVITVTKTDIGTEEGTEEGETESTGAEPEVLTELSLLAKQIRIVNPPEDLAAPVGFEKRNIKVGKVTVPGWVWSVSNNVKDGKAEEVQTCLFYAMNENDELDFYRYDNKDNTIQRYIVDETTENYALLSTEYNNLCKDYATRGYIVNGLAAAVGVLLLLLIVTLVSKGKTKKNRQYPQTTSSVRTSRGKKMSKEERYMMGDEDEYMEDEKSTKIPLEAYQPEVLTASGTAAADTIIADSREIAEMADMEKTIAVNLAKETAATSEEFLELDDEDFEFFDLDEDL